MRNNDFQKIDSDSLIHNAQRNFEPYLSVLEQHGLTPKRVGNSYRFMESSGLSLYRHQNGQILLKNHSEKLDLPSGGIYGLVAHIHRLDPSKDFQEICGLIAAYSGQSVPFKGDFSEITTTKYQHKTKKFIPNQGQKLKRSSRPTFADWESPIGMATLKYFSRWGITEKTLRKYNVVPLTSIRPIKKDYDIKFSPQNFAFAYCTDAQRGNIKAKRPYAGKEFYIQNTGNYCFGYNQLPQKGDTLIICAGEKDCLTINQHLNQFGIFAICYHSETANIDPAHLKKLRQRFRLVFTCFDNDKDKKQNTGRRMMHKHATKLGIPFVDISKYSKQNDVSDIMEFDGLEKLKQIFAKECATKHAVARRKGDPYSIPVADALRLDVDEYVGEEKPLGWLTTLIAENPRLALQAPTGSGKTWALMKAATKNCFFEDGSGFEYIIFCLPTTALLEQAHADYENAFGGRAAVIYGNTTDVEIAEAEQNHVIFTTYDSLHKIGISMSEGNNTLLIVDEFHELRNARSYRSEAVDCVLEYTQLAKQSVLVSATPLYHFTTNLVDCADYRLCVVNKKISQKIIVQPLRYDGGSEKDIMQDFLKHTTEEDKVYLVRKNDVGLLESFKKKAESEGLSMDILSSKYPKYKDQNTNYQSIMETGDLARKVNIIGTTSLMEAGTSFKFDVGGVAIINEKCRDSVVQFCARPRYNPQTFQNKTLQVRYYYKATKNTPKTHQKHTLERQKELIALAKRQADYMNKHQSACTETKRKYLDDFKFVCYSELWGCYKISYLAILAHEYEHEKANSSAQEMFKRISHYQPHIEFLPPKNIDLEEDLEVDTDARENRAKRKELKRESFNLLNTEGANVVLEAAYHNSTNTKLRASIKKHIAIGKELSEDAEQLTQQYPEIVSQGILDRAAIRYIELKELGIPEQKIPQILCDHQKTSKYRLLKNTLITEKELEQDRLDPSKLSGKSAARVRNYKKIIKAVNRKKDALRKREGSSGRLLKGELVGLVRDTIGDKFITEKRAIMRIKELFELDIERHKEKKSAKTGDNKKRKSFRTYTIGNRKKTSEIFRTYSISRSEWVSDSIPDDC